jgi:prolyl-tRNA synthetase
MLQSELFTKTEKNIPKDEKSINAILLQRAGFVHKEMAGVYSFLPLGLKVLRKIENITREEMKKIGGEEIFMTVLQPKELWQKTNRWSEGVGKNVMYKTSQFGQEIGLGPTHEEMLTNIVRNYVKSYEDLPKYVFQIQTKFRKELRPKSGLLRGREFGMKDLYSFNKTEESFRKFYNKVKKAYFNIFKRCKLQAILTEASGAGFTKDYTHEFQVLTKDGEDTITYCPKLHFSQNKEITKYKKGDKCPVCKRALKQGKSIEVGNIFPLGTKYSEALGAFYQDRNGEKKPIVMGSYGIGTSRLMGAIVEVFHDKNGMIWPLSVAPFHFHLLKLNSSDKKTDLKVKSISKKLYFNLQKKGFEVLYDDRINKSSGEKLVEADLIGLPYRIVVSEKTVKKNSVEVKERNKKQVKVVKLNNLNKFLQEVKKLIKNFNL